MVCALASACCFGTASVLQAVAARAVETGSGSGVDPVLLLRALRQWRYAAGLCLDGLGFLLQVVALRSLPLYAVGASLAASLAVTAVVAVWLLDARLSVAEWAAVATMCVGLALVVLASGAQGQHPGAAALRWSLPGLVLVVLVTGALAGRLADRPRALLLGLGAGAGFGVVEVGVRLIGPLEVPRIFGDPTLYALVLGGAAGFLLLTSALQRGSVTVATAGMVLVETAGPAVVGLLWLGDRPRSGFEWLAAAGFLASVAGALALTRFGDPAAEVRDGPEPPSRRRRPGRTPGGQPPQRQ
ncbi:hypothetical protein [Streptomyces sp. AD55]|uniref:hypothetical protein n=1 Tax=Streptomyces sp. AD55 TaxID=3242895 RepID=UPI0035279A07